MKCGDKEWQHCQVEKIGCEGCYYNEIDIEKAIDVALTTVLENLNKRKLTDEERIRLIDKVLNLRKFNKYADKPEFKKSLNEFWEKVYQLEKWGEER